MDLGGKMGEMAKVQIWGICPGKCMKRANKRVHWEFWGRRSGARVLLNTSSSAKEKIKKSPPPMKKEKKLPLLIFFFGCQWKPHTHTLTHFLFNSFIHKQTNNYISFVSDCISISIVFLLCKLSMRLCWPIYCLVSKLARKQCAKVARLKTGLPV